jgi:hypothetical protein
MNSKNDFTRTFERIVSICNDLIHTNQYEGVDVVPDLLPEERGIYLWTFATNNKPAYVGSALGKDGLRQRIIRQHLRPTYTKSCFRKAVQPLVNGDKKHDAVEYIRRNFRFTFLPCPDATRATLLAAEAVLIAALHPSFNKVRGDLPKI